MLNRLKFFTFFSAVSSFSSLSSLSIFLMLMGCAGGVKTLIKLRPLADQGAIIQATQGSVTLEKESVRVTVTFYDRVRLEGVTDSVVNNPFLSESKALCTVFQIEVENKREGKIQLNAQKFVILDGLGNQSNGLSLSDFERWYPSTSSNSLSYSYVFNEYTPTVVYTPDFYKRKAAQEKLLKGGELYPGVKQVGLAAFDPIRLEAMKITLIVPVLPEGKGQEVLAPIEFKFEFAQEISPRF